MFFEPFLQSFGFNRFLLRRLLTLRQCQPQLGLCTLQDSDVLYLHSELLVERRLLPVILLLTFPPLNTGLSPCGHVVRPVHLLGRDWLCGTNLLAVVR